MKAEVLVNNYVKLLDPAYPTHEISDTISRVQIPCSTEMYMLPSMISGTYRFQVTNEFSCGRTKTIQERNVRPRIFFKMGEKTSIYKLIRKNDGALRMATMWIFFISSFTEDAQNNRLFLLWI